MAEAPTVVKLTPNTYAADARTLLEDALRLGATEVILIARYHDGRDYEASQFGDAETLWRVEQFKRRLIEP